METRRRIRHRQNLLVVAALAGLLFAVAYWLVNAQVRPALRQTALVRVNAMTSEAMYQTVLAALAEQEDWAPFVEVAAEGGKVYCVSLNNRELTQFASHCAQKAQEELTRMGLQGVEMPLGSVSGISLFAGWGPPVNLSFQPEINVQAYFESEFRGAGINQTMHRVNLRLESQIAILLPGEPQTVHCFVDVAVAETIIVGDVPNTYANVGENLDYLEFAA